MASFDFVTDDALRASLEQDFREMTDSLEAGAYKATQVLAGSVVEALLVEHLTGIGHTPKGGKSVLDLTLGELLVAARSEKILSATTTDLGSVVKDYRNLIHPGRLIRLAESVDYHTARIASDLVEIIVKDVARGKQATYGYTANQIVKKVESDSSSAAIVGDLLRDAPPPELERLLMATIPNRYLEISSSNDIDDEAALVGLRRTYHAAMDIAPDDLRRRVMDRYVRVLKEQPEFEVLRFEEAFLRASDLHLLDTADAGTAKAHVIDQVVRDFGPRLENALGGFGQVSSRDELTRVSKAVIQFVAAGNGSERRRLAERVLRDLWISADTNTDTAVPEAIASWERGTGPKEWKTWLSGMRRSMRNPWEPEPDESLSANEESDLDDLPF